MKKLTAAWVKKAEADYVRAAKLARFLPDDHDGRCFSCQQAAEKYLKALLVELGLAVPRTHNLDDLHRLLHAHHPSALGSLMVFSFLLNIARDVLCSTSP